MKSHSIGGLALILVLISAVYFITARQSDGKLVKNLIVNIKDEGDTSHFVSYADIKKIITEYTGKQLSDMATDDLNMRALERILKENVFVADCHVSKDFAGNIVVDIRENKPYARILTSFGKGAYLSEKGEILPLSERSAARVMLIGGSGADKMLREGFWLTEQGKEVFEFISFIEKSDFWKAQISELHFDEYFNVVLLPQVGDERIEFGGTDNFQRKFDNLTLYYNQIVPHKGWQKYKTVNLKIGNQIICK
jgi:cell division protein FtsQ